MTHDPLRELRELRPEVARAARALRGQNFAAATPGPLPRLFHYTCDHGATGIDAEGRVVPHMGVVWATNAGPAFARREWLGLTSYALSCDRMAHCYEVDPASFAPWNPATAPVLGRTPGAHPELWWTASTAASVLRKVY